MKKQILDIVNSCESKNFKDHDIFSMFILKIINQTVDSFCILCNLSCNSGIFPEAMKIVTGVRKPTQGRVTAY